MIRYRLACTLVLVVSLISLSAATAGAAGKAPPKKQSHSRTQPHRQYHPAPFVPAGWPKVLDIPRIGVRAPIESLPLTQPKDASAPYRWTDTAWYNKSPRPGEPGRALVFGHLDSYCCPAVFWHLQDLHKGDRIQVTYKNGKMVNFQVTWTRDFLDSQVPWKYLYTRGSERGIALITCAGVFHGSTIGYDHRFIVYGRLLLPNGKLS